jgi:hypothetical protein
MLIQVKRAELSSPGGHISKIVDAALVPQSIRYVEDYGDVAVEQHGPADQHLIRVRTDHETILLVSSLGALLQAVSAAEERPFRLGYSFASRPET